MADPTNARIRDGVQKPPASIDGNELVELDDLAINIGDPNFFNSTLNVLSDWYNHRWIEQSAPNGIQAVTVGPITFNDGTRTLTIPPASNKLILYSAGKLFIHTTPDIKVISNVEGIHWIYYNDTGTLVDVVNPDFEQGLDFLRYFAIAVMLYWDVTNQQAIYFTRKNELHEINMPGSVHGYLHYTEGTKYINGCKLTNVQKDQSGALDSHAQFGLSEGFIKDEDIKLWLVPVGSTIGLPIFYLDGTSEKGDLRRQFNSGFSVLTTGTGRLAYNQWTGSTWQLTEVQDNKFVNYFVFGYNDGDYGYCAFMGQTEYNSKRDAEEAATTEAITIIKGNFQVAEALACATIIFQTSSSYGNAVKARVVGDPLDLTQSNINLALSLNLAHDTLTGKELAAPSDVFWGHVDADLYALFINPDQEHAYYFGEHGNDTWNAKKIERAVQDPQVAINLAQALTPAVDNRFSINCSDAYQYSAPSNLYSWININAPNARFRGGSIGVADNCHVVLYHFDNEGIIGRVIFKTGIGISSLNIHTIEGRIEIDAGTLFVTTNQIIAPNTTDEYIDVPSGSILYLQAHKVKGKITVESGGTAYLYINDTDELTENFAAGSTVYKFYLDGQNQEHAYYFLDTGSDSNDGKRIENPFLTPYTAITAAQALTPSATNRFSINCPNAADYPSPTNIYPWINIFAPMAKFITPEFGGINLEDNVHIIIDEINDEDDSNRIITKTETGISSITSRLIQHKIQFGIAGGELHINCDRFESPLGTEEYITVKSGTKLYLKAKSFGSKIGVESGAELHIELDDSSEIIENFAVGAIVYTNYKDNPNPRKSVTSGSFDIEPWHEGTIFNNKAASANINLNLPPATADMFGRKPYGFYVSDSETFYENIIADGANKIRIVDVNDIRLRSKTNGCFVSIYCSNVGEWAAQGMIGSWDLDSGV